MKYEVLFFVNFKNDILLYLIERGSNKTLALVDKCNIRRDKMKMRCWFERNRRFSKIQCFNVCLLQR